MKNKKILKNWRLLQNCGDKKGLSIDTGTEEIPLGGSSVQSDWSQNDPNAADYVKNRTHYAETVEATVLEKTTFTELEEGLDEDSGATRCYYAEFYRELTLVDGKTYFVTFNGVRYECVYDSDSEVLGNLSIWGEGDDTGEPFVIAPWSACTKTDEPFTVVITTMEESVTTIPEKYLPPEEYDLVVGFVCQNRQSNIDVDSFRILSGSARKVIDLLKANKPVKVALVGERYDAADGERITAIYHPTSFWVDIDSFNMSWDMWVHEYNPTEGKKGMMLIINRDNSIGIHRAE
jgi:hypothetical protein